MKKKLFAVLTAASMALAVTVPALADYYPGGSVQYHENDPAPDYDVEITSDGEIIWTVAACLQETNPQSQALKLSSYAKDYSVNNAVE